MVSHWKYGICRGETVVENLLIRNVSGCCYPQVGKCLVLDMVFHCKYGIELLLKKESGSKKSSCERIDVVSVVKVATIDQTLVFIYLRNDETSTKLQRNLNGKNTRKKKVENEVE